MKSHHTTTQVDRAFAYAPIILRKLELAGVRSPRFELYADASGVLWLERELTSDQFHLACDLVRSNRRPAMPPRNKREVGIAFCCGLVDAAEREGY